MDRPGNPMGVTGLMVVRERLDLERFRAIIAARFLGYKRFRQRPDRDLQGL